jgi:hypothetical protein
MILSYLHNHNNINVIMIKCNHFSHKTTKVESVGAPGKLREYFKYCTDAMIKNLDTIALTDLS